MDKTTLYLPHDLKIAVRRAATEQGVPEAEVIRRAIRESVGGMRPQPHGGLFAGSDAVARRADEHLRGFGER